MDDDTALLRHYARTRDADAFAELVRRYAGMVYGVCLRITGSSHDAEDVTQECFLQLAQSAGAVTRSVPGWLHVLATSRAVDAVRGSTSRRRHEEQAMKEKPDETEPPWEKVSPHVDEALAALPEEYRVPLTLHYLVGRSQIDVGKELGLDDSTISRRLKKGVDELREKLKKAGVIVPAAILAVLLAENASAAAVPAALVAALGKMALAGVGKGAGATAAGAAGKAAALGLGAFKTKLIAAAVAAAVAAVGVVAYKQLSEKEASTRMGEGSQAAAGPAASKAQTIAWGQATEGLQAGLDVKGRRFEEGEAVEVEVRVRNVGERALSLLDVGKITSWRIVLTPVVVGTPLRASWRVSRRTRQLVWTLGKGQGRLAVRPLIGGEEWEFVNADSPRRGGSGVASAKTLPPGRYAVAASYGLTKHIKRYGHLSYCWPGNVTTGAVEIEITAKTETEAPAGQVAWGDATEGLRAGLEIEERRFRAGAPIEVAVHLRNAGETTLNAPAAQRKRLWRVYFAPEDGSATRGALHGKYLLPGLGPVGVFRLAPSEARLAARYQIGGQGWKFVEMTPPNRFPTEGASETAPAVLSPGRYAVTATYQWERAAAEGDWHGRAMTGAVEIEITAKAEAAEREPVAQSSKDAGATPAPEEDEASRREIRRKLEWKISLTFGGTPLKEVITFLEEGGPDSPLTGITVRIDRRAIDVLGDRPVSFTLNNASLEEVLAEIVRLAEHEYRIEDDGILIYPSKELLARAQREAARKKAEAPVF